MTQLHLKNIVKWNFKRFMVLYQIDKGVFLFLIIQKLKFEIYKYKTLLINYINLYNYLLFYKFLEKCFNISNKFKQQL